MATKKKHRKTKRLLLLLVALLLLFAGYVEIINRNSSNMTYRQKVLKAVYPAWMWFARITGKNTKTLKKEVMPTIPFHNLNATLNNGDSFNFSTLRGKKVLLVNTASDCGYTDQYSELQKLYEQHGDKLAILAFPANDFKSQEKGTDQEIAAFCRNNYAISFPLFSKSIVVKQAGQNPVYRWLTDSAMNGWNSLAPEWNFSKYLVSEDGILINYFGASVSPLDKKITDAINQ